ncbi:hypothetical protein BDZ89DRAFT_1165604 [Hymenopellis radicata]|nr:hypothetical protein BDZ89DRAFT_1165604 [Hymenopellis radicata]
MYSRGTKRKARHQIVSTNVTKKTKTDARKGFLYLPKSIVRRMFACLYSEDPLMLSHVCQQWRNVALGMPELWSTIRLKGALDLFRARHYIERSDKMLLSLELGSEKPHNEMSCSDDHRNILCLLFDSRDRWRHISVGLPGMTLHTLTSICGFLPHLSSVRVRGELLNDLKVVPHLKNPFRDILWQSVSTVSFSGCTFDSVAATLRQFTNVSRLQLGNISFPDEYETPDTATTGQLLQVKSLVVDPSGVSLRLLFCRISAASLEHLELADDVKWDNGGGQPLWFPTSSELKFKLKTLTIKNVATPALKRLVIHEPYSMITPMFMTYLRHLRDEVRPELEYLELVWDMACHEHDAQIVPWDFYLTGRRVRGSEEARVELCAIYEGMVLNMVENQVAKTTEVVLGSRRIYSVEGGGFDTVHPVTRERISKLQDEGWRISVR